MQHFVGYLTSFVELEASQAVSVAGFCVSSSFLAAFHNGDPPMVTMMKHVHAHPAASEVYHIIGSSRQGNIVRQLHLSSDLVERFGDFLPPTYATAAMLVSAHNALEESAIIKRCWGNLSQESHMHALLLQHAARMLKGPQELDSITHRQRIERRVAAGDLRAAVGTVLDGFADVLAGWRRNDLVDTVRPKAPPQTSSSVQDTLPAPVASATASMDGLNPLLNPADFDLALEMLFTSGQDWLDFLAPDALRFQ